MPDHHSRRATFSIALTWGVSWGVLGTAAGFYGMLRNFIDYGRASSGPLGALGEGAVAAFVGTALGLLIAWLVSRAELRGTLGERPRQRLMIGGAVAGVSSVALFALLRVLLGARLDPDTLLWAAVWFGGLGADSGMAAVALVRWKRRLEIGDWRLEGEGRREKGEASWRRASRGADLTRD